MSRRTVHTQAELDAALADKAVDTVYIESPEGVWLRVSDNRSSHVVARGSSHVVARGSSHVEAWESSHVVAWGSSHVEAWGSSHVVARGSSHVVARGSSHVVAWGSSHVVAWGSSHVVAWGSSHVEAWESSHVVAWESSHVEARGSSHVVARGSSHVEAGTQVAVHVHSGQAEVSGGVLIDLTALDLSDPQAWCDYHGVKVVDGIATVYKAVDDEYVAGRQYTATSYAPGSTPNCNDFRADGYCGGGLHFGPTPGHAVACDRRATKFLAVGVRLSEMNVIDGNDHSYTAKCKAPRVVTPCVEVDRYGNPVPVAAVVA